MGREKRRNLSCHGEVLLCCVLLVKCNFLVKLLDVRNQKLGPKI